MGFFAGRLNNTPTLSLKRGSGGDINQHINPDNNTIFHSNMPHVIITETHSANLALATNEYYWATMPSRIVALHNNDSNLVILTEIEFTDGTRHMINGMSMGVGVKAYGTTNPQVSSGGGNKIQITASADLSLDVGYFNTGTSGSVVEKLRDGTGCQHMFGSYAMRRGFATAAMYMGSAALYKSAWDGSSNVVADRNTLTVKSSSIRHPGSRSLGFNAIYVRGRSCPRIVYGYNGPNHTTAGRVQGVSSSAAEMVKNYNSTDPSSMAWAVGFARAAPHGYAYWEGMSDPNNGPGGPIGIYSESLGVTPKKVTWYVTNLRYTGSGFTVGTDLFKGSDIKISPNDFTIRGVNLSTTSWKFINFVQPGYNPGSRADIRNIGNNVSSSSNSTGVNGIATFAVPVTNGSNAPLFKGGNVGGLTNSTVSIYSFMPSSSWYAQSTPPKIGNKYGDVWSESNIPLRLIAGSASATLSGNVVFSSGSSVHLTTMGLGIQSARDGAIVCTMEFLDDTWLSAGGIGCFNPNEILNRGATTGDSRFRISSNAVSKKLHQILSLPSGKYVPFLTIKGTAVNATGGGGAMFTPTAFWVSSLYGGNAQTGYYTITYYLKNDGNGNVSVWLNASVSNVVGLKACLPNVKITIQRLT